MRRMLRFKEPAIDGSENLNRKLLRLLICDGQEDVVIDGDGTLEENRRIAARNRHVICAAAQRRAGGLRFASRAITGLN